MAALALAYSECDRTDVLTIASLRAWMKGRWALLFSHADDFACYGFEADRWLAHVEHEFAKAEVSPLSVIKNGRGGVRRTWVDRVGGAALLIRWGDAHRARGAGASERSLISSVLMQATRFVLVVDEALRPRLTYVYSIGERLPSPIELVWMAHRVRERSAE